MKILSKLMLILVFVLGYSTTNAQDENNPWQIDLGINAVDFYPTGEDAPLGDSFEGRALPSYYLTNPNIIKRKFFQQHNRQTCLWLW